MESALTKACTIKLQNFEGPFDLLFHLIEKNQVNIYDIPVNEITDQYMDYLFAMRRLDLEVASEFLVMAATLLHIKSRMLLPGKKGKSEDEIDPREELVLRLVEYKRYKDFSAVLRDRERYWSRILYKLPEIIEHDRGNEALDLSPGELRNIYKELLIRNESKKNPHVGEITQIIQHERISLKSKMREIIRILMKKPFFMFSEVFNAKKKSKTEIVTGLLAILELVKLRKAKISQKKLFSEIVVSNMENQTEGPDNELIAAEH